jgi:hypothetical protein
MLLITGQRLLSKWAQALRQDDTRKIPFRSDSFCVMQDETFPIEFVGGSQDGEIVEATSAPDFCELPVADGIVEIYKRENDEPPFIYVQIGYSGRETWK